MREEDHGARYLSPLVKQDLAKLDTDGDTRRLAVTSLKLFVEQLDSSTLPRFISQVAESREPVATRSYAILLYEEVARVHGKLVVPYIPKVMAAVIRSSAASGSFPQLQSACARVTAALARHCITSAADAEEIMSAICAPLVDALSGKLEPVVATAAASLHALAETERWKHVREETVHEVCHRTAVALSEKATRTAAHMQLIRILASVSPDVVSVHGASLLRAGEEILKVNANSWQLRKAAAQLLQSVLTVLDKETLDTELDSALHALDSCRLDKMPHVRAAVSEALHTAKMLASGTVSSSSWSPRTPVKGRASVFNSPRGASVSPTSQESRRFSFSPTSTSASDCSAQAPPVRRRGTRTKRAPLYPARASPSSSTTTAEECESPSRRLNVNVFKVTSRVSPDEDDAVPAQLIDLGMKEAQVDGTTQPERTNVAHDISSGEDSRVDGHVELVLPRLKMSNAGGQACVERFTPTPKDSSITPSDGEPAHADVEVEKREVFTGSLLTPKAASLQHKTNFALLNGSLELDESAKLDFPKRLVRSLSNLAIPEARDQQDVKLLAHDDPLVPNSADADETSSEAGWSVRDNPIASEDSFRGESSDEETFTTTNFSQPVSLTVSPRTSVVSPNPPDDTEQTCRLISKSVQPPSCGLSSLLLDDETSAKCESPCRVSETSLTVKKGKVAEERVETTPRSERCLVMMVSQKYWKKFRCYTETALGGSLCLVIALPLAMIVVKALNHGARECHHLVPT